MKQLGCTNVEICDISRTDYSKALSLVFRYSNIVFATTTYNGSIFPTMDYFLDLLIEHKIQNKTLGIIGNGSWNNMVDKVITTKFIKTTNNHFLENKVLISSSLNGDNINQIKELAKELLKYNKN